jgi:hypothetical protein
MSTKRPTKSPDWLMESKTPPGSNPLLEAMKQRGIPLTKEAYLKMAYPEGVPDPLPPEVEADLPDSLRD